ncbi:MAG: GAF domain-containing protein [Bryobacteraceae bacterium]
MTLLDQVEAAVGLDEALEATLCGLRADSGTIHLLEPDGLLHLKAHSRGIPEVVLQTVRTVPVGKGMAGLAVERGKPVDACNIQTDSSGDVRPGARATGMAGAIVVPILRGEEPVGALGVANRSEREFTAEETELLLTVGRAIAKRKELWD